MSELDCATCSVCVNLIPTCPNCGKELGQCRCEIEPCRVCRMLRGDEAPTFSEMTGVWLSRNHVYRIM